MTHPEPVVLALDVGTTSTKAGAYTTSGGLVAAASSGYALRTPHAGHAVQDAGEILDAVFDAARRVVDAVGADRVAGISFSAQMHSLLGLDEAYRPLTPVLTWADTRADAQAEALRAGDRSLALHHRTGTPVHPMSPLCKLVWFREAEPALHARVPFWCGIKDWLLVRLCGAFVVDHSLASASGLLDVHTLAWDAEALALAGVTPAQLPTLVPTRHVLDALTPEAAERLGLPAATPVVVGAGDGPLANLGVGAIGPGVASCSIGTSGALRVVVDRPAVDRQGGVFCYVLTEDRWVVGGAINNGGATLDWVRGLLTPDAAPGDEAELLALAARARPGSGGLIMLPALLGERAPHWSTLSRGAYIGLTRAHRREHLVRAAIEGVCLQLDLVLASMRAAGLEITTIRMTGGVTRSALWRRILADVLDTPLEFAEGPEGSGLGAAILGMDALGLVASIDVASELVPVHERMAPDAEAAAVYRRIQPVFESLHGQLMPAYRKLRRLAPSLPLDLDPA